MTLTIREGHQRRKQANITALLNRSNISDGRPDESLPVADLPPSSKRSLFSMSVNGGNDRGNKAAETTPSCRVPHRRIPDDGVLSGRNYRPEKHTRSSTRQRPSSRPLTRARSLGAGTLIMPSPGKNIALPDGQLSVSLPTVLRDISPPP